MSKSVNVEGSMEVKLKDGTVVYITEFEHMSALVVIKENVKVEVTFGKESNNTVEVRTIAPLKVHEKEKG